MWWRAIAAAALVLAACVKTEVTSYTDPAFRPDGKFASVLVAAFGTGLQETQTVESAAVQAFAAKGVRALRSLDVIPPTRQMTEAEIAAAIQATGAASLLMIVATEKGATQHYVPPSYTPGDISGAINTVGPFAQLHLRQSPGHFSPGYTVSKPNARYFAMLGDLGNGGIVWMAEVAAREASLLPLATADHDALARSMAGEVVAKLAMDGVI